MERPTMESLRQFARLPWIRCPSCNKVTSRVQSKYDAILEDKRKVYYDNVEEILNTLLSQGFDEMTAQGLADQQARVIADVKFNRRITQDLGLSRYCCMKTLQNPIILPLGSGIKLDPDVDVGQRMSELQISHYLNPLIPEMKREGNDVPKPRRLYRAI